ncbi:MAG: DUF3828 domain-containing protein [Pseudomonadota bacterium]
MYLSLRSLVAILAVAAATPNAFAQLGDSNAPDTLVRSLYQAHQPWAKKEVQLSDARQATLFLSPSLGRLIQLDEACSKKTQEIANLDFDPILAAQDYDERGIGNLTIKLLSTTSSLARVEASFLWRPDDEKTRTKITYSLLKFGEHWKIDDISYREPASLKTLLSKPIAECKDIKL